MRFCECQTDVGVPRNPRPHWLALAKGLPVVRGRSQPLSFCGPLPDGRCAGLCEGWRLHAAMLVPVADVAAGGTGGRGCSRSP